MIDYAKYHRLGLCLIPLQPKLKQPDGEWERYQTQKPDTEQLVEWFSNGSERNAAIVCGSISSVVCIDTDTPEAEAWAAANLPLTPMRTRTQRGRHRYYRRPYALNIVPAFIKVEGLSIEIRRDGQYAVAPGSVHPSGFVYEEEEPWPESLEAVPLLPMDVIQGISHTPTKKEPLPPGVTTGGRNQSLFKEACRVRRLGWTEEEIYTAVMTLNKTRCKPPLSQTEVKQIVKSSVKYPAEEDVDLVLNPEDPMPGSREFVERRYVVDGIRTIHHQDGEFFGYNVSSYIARDEPSVRSELYKFLEGAKRWEKGELQPFQPSKRKVENFLDALRAVCNLPTTKKAPCWLQDRDGLAPLDMLACQNGLLHIPTRVLHPATPYFFTLNGIDFNFDATAPTPSNWLAFLNSVWPDDAETIETLQEIFGYLLTPDTRQQKIFMMVGPKRSGKGITGRILRHLLGELNVCSPTLASFGHDFGKQPLIGKTLAVISDARISGRTDTAMVAETLLSISGEDAQTVPRKYLTDWNGRLSTRFLVLTNELPRITDASGALASRFITLVMTESHYGREDLGLEPRLLGELPGILNWALDGRDRLLERGYFIQPGSAHEMIQEFEDLGSPEAAFLRECTSMREGASVGTQVLFNAWVAWCKANGREYSGNTATFGRNVRAALPWVTVGFRGNRADRERHWIGLALEKQDEPPF